MQAANATPTTKIIKRLSASFKFIFLVLLRRSVNWFFPAAKSGVRVRAHIYNLEDVMDKSRSFSRPRRIIVFFLLLSVTAAAGIGARLVRAQSSASLSSTDSALIADFRRVEVASVSDALEQLTGKRMYMSHQMQPIFTTKFAGFARTVQLKKDEGNNDPAALSGMLAAIDEGAPNSVYVMAAKDGSDIAGMGGLMGTAMASRGYSGAVIDGGVRDVAYLRKIGFPVFATGIVPSTSVHHYRFAGSQIGVTCDGVPVNPGDIIVADSGGGAVVPPLGADGVL